MNHVVLTCIDSNSLAFGALECLSHAPKSLSQREHEPKESLTLFILVVDSQSGNNSFTKASLHLNFSKASSTACSWSYNPYLLSSSSHGSILNSSSFSWIIWLISSSSWRHAIFGSIFVFGATPATIFVSSLELEHQSTSPSLAIPTSVILCWVPIILVITALLL